MSETNKVFFDLQHDDAIARDAEIPPRERNLGGTKGVDDASLKNGNIRIYYGDRPIVFNLLEWYAKLGKPIPEDIQIFDAYRVYIIFHTIGTVKTWGTQYLEQLGLRVKFDSQLGEEVTVLNVLPQPEFIKIADGKIVFNADIGLNGKAELPKVDIKGDNGLQPFGVDGKIGISSKADFALNVSYTLNTPHIMAIGRGSSRSEWVFNRHEKGLTGYDIQMGQVVMVSQFVQELSFKVQLYATLESFNLIAIDRETDWVDMKITLPNSI